MSWCAPPCVWYLSEFTDISISDSSGLSANVIWNMCTIVVLVVVVVVVGGGGGGGGGVTVLLFLFFF